jgi:FMN phosphatase YigB (HAD superfamily)
VITAILSGDDAGPRHAAIDEQIRSRLGGFLDGAPGSPEYLDGYAAVADLAADHATSEQLQAAYQASRQALATGTLTVSTPPGLAAFLHTIGPGVERVLVTNAPPSGIAETLSALGLRNAIDRIITSAGKPAGWSDLLPDLIGARPASHVMAVGDIWGNDLAAPHAAGCATALIDRFGHHAGPANLTARTFEELYPGIHAWAADPDGFVAAHPARVDAIPSPQH